MGSNNRSRDRKGFNIKNKKTKLTLWIVVVILGFVSYTHETKGFETFAGTTTDMNLSGESDSSEDSIKLDWESPDQSEPYTYQIYSKKPNTQGFQTISAVDLNQEVKVLNVYPKNVCGTALAGNVTYTDARGEPVTTPVTASLKRWMEEPTTYTDTSGKVVNVPKGYGQGLISVDIVEFGEYNTNTGNYLKDANGNWKYDVVALGIGDCNGNTGLTETSKEKTSEFIDSGRGVFFGHDSVYTDAGRKITASLAEEYMNLTVTGTKSYRDTKVQIERDGLLTRYPWDIGGVGTELTIPESHTSTQVPNDITDNWMKFSSGESELGNFYLTSYNNLAMSQTGHSTGQATPDEQKIVANTMFYLSQLTTDTNLTDRSAMDVQAPKFQSSDATVQRETTKIQVDFPDAEEVDSVFEYYVEYTGVDTGKTHRSETIRVSNTSGFAGYSYVNDSNPTTVPDNIVDTTESNLEIPVGTTQPKYVHVVAVDKKGNISEPLHITLDNTPPKLEITKGTEGWTKNEVIFTIKVSDEESGINSLTIPERGVYTYKGDKNPTSTYGTYTTNGKRVIVVEDMAGNRTEAEINVNNIDKDLPGLTVDYTPKGWTNKNVEITATGKDALSGIRNVRMETDRTSKNILPMADLQSFGVKDLTRNATGVEYSTDGTQQYEGLTISDKITEANQWYVLSFDITKLSGTIPIIGGHSHIASESKVYIDGKLVNTGSHIAWDTSVPYPNDTKKHHVTVVFYTGNYNATGDKKLYIQPTRREVGYPYEVSIENVQLEKGKEETPYEPNYIDLLTEKNPLTVNVSENGVYKFITTDNAGNEYQEDIEINTIDKIPPTAYDINNATEWTGNSVTFKVYGEDSLSGISDIIPDTEGEGTLATENGETSYTYTATKNGNYDFRIIDNAGNETIHRVTVDKIDNTIPEIDLKYTPAKWTNENIQVTATGVDNGSGIKNVRMTTDLNSKNMVSMKSLGVWYTGGYEKQGSSIQYTSDSPAGRGGVYIPSSLIEPDEWYTLSFDITKLSGEIEVIGGHLHLSNIGSAYIDGEKVEGTATTMHRFNRMPYPNDNEKHHITVKILTNNYHEVGDKNIYIQPNRDFYGLDYEVLLENIQFEKGTEETPHEPNYLDGLEDVNPLVLTISDNGEYTFTATDNVGNENTETINITNIDRVSPTATVTGNPEEYTKEDEVTLSLETTDDLSGVKSITLPDRKVVTGDKTVYKVNANGKYDFIITDNAGNTTTKTITVDKLMIPYTFYLYDSKGAPIQGAGFDLMRDGVKYADAISDGSGIVDFGKVPPTGKYTIKQTKAPDGYVIDPTEKDVEVDDETEPEEFISYPRGEILPATGNKDSILYTTLLVTIFIGVTMVITKKMKINK